MDSLTQFTLGACVGLAALGPRAGARRAAVLGGVLGTLPDLDVFLPFEDPIDAFVLHRSWSHSLLVHAALTPVLGEALARLAPALRGERWRAWLAVFLCLSTHALLDALTIYGTQLFWPLWPTPIGAGSVFIVDPLYTLPLLFVTLWALIRPAWTPGLRRALCVSLAASTLYLGWGLVAQQAVLEAAARTFAAAGVRPERVLATPTPFNTLLWRAIAVEPDRYLNLYVPALGEASAEGLRPHARGAALAACIDGLDSFRRLAAFSKGFYRVSRDGSDFIVADLRMGLTPNYVFQFAVARSEAGGVRPIPPARRPTARSAPGDLDWLIANVAGAAVARPAEAKVEPAELRSAPAC